jgi:transcriptional regulator with PAS, ATPase and Fis domain
MGELTSITEMQAGPTPATGRASKRLWAICRAAERTEIGRALVENGHNRTHAASALGISRRTLLNKIKAYGLTRAVCRQLAGDQPQQPQLVRAS